MALWGNLPSVLSQPATDNSTASVTQLPANILETFIPGYSIISKFLFEVLGFDITLLVSTSILVFGLSKAIQYLWQHAYSGFKTYFMSFVSIDSDDDIYEHIMDWLADQKVSQDSRSLMARTGTPNAWDADDVDFDEDDGGNDGALLNFSHWDAKVAPKFQPYFGLHRFFHNGRLFEFSRENKQTMYQGWGGSILQNEEVIKLTCIGRSTRPIKELIQECQDRYFKKESSRTIVRRPATKEVRSRGRNPWTKVATRPSRPMDTVVLDHDQKQRVLADINEYLHPATPRWYANRGIPYRRGYLFHGPPGTGKTSLSFAIAGVFGLDIYCISLLEPTLTEEDLGLLFNNLPRRCVVLLEDIDSAGLVKREDNPTDDASKDKDADAKQIGAEIAKALKSAQDKNEKSKTNNQGISLSGLLNAIDGVASHEGRVLVMTTNFPEKLDDALIRPGRVDMKVGFTMASRSQIRELFTRMYSDTPKPLATVASSGSSASVAQNKSLSKLAFANGNTHTAVNGHAHTNGTVKENTGLLAEQTNGVFTPPATPNDSASSIPIMELKDIAAEFAERLPEDTFTPAEIRGFGFNWHDCQRVRVTWKSR